jgi:O-antigen ligase
VPTVERFSWRAAWPALAIGAGAAALAAVRPWWIGFAAAGAIAALALGWYLLAAPRRWLAALFFALMLLPPLPLDLGDTGPHPAIAFAALGLLAGLLRPDMWRLRWGAVESSLAALLLALTASLGFAAAYSGTAVAAASAARVMLFGIGVYVFVAAAHGPARASDAEAMRATRFLFYGAMAAAAFGCIDFLYQLPAPAGFEPQFLWLASGVYRRAQGLFYESSTLGNFCSFFLVLAGVSLAMPRERRIAPLPVVLAGAALFFSALLLSFSRASVAACAISLGVLAALERRRWFRKSALAALAAVAVIAIFAFAAVAPEVAQGYWGRVKVALESFQDAPDQALSGRLETWTRLAGFIAEHPWRTMFGLGYKTLPYTEHLGAPVIADNMYLSLLVETGVLGLVALAALNISILAASWRALRQGSVHGKWLFCFWMGESIQMLTGDILTYWRVLPLYFWVLAQVVRERTDADSADRPVR